MEVKDYFKVITKNLWVIILITAVFAIAAYVVASRKPLSYQASTAISVTKQSETSAKEFYTFDNYYTIQAASVLSDSLVGLFASPSFVFETFQKAGYDLPSIDLKSLAKLFTAKKQVATSAVITVNYSDNDELKATKIIKTATSGIETYVESSYSGKTGNFEITATEPVVVPAPKTTGVNTFIAAFVGLFVSLGIVFVKESLSK